MDVINVSLSGLAAGYLPKVPIDSIPFSDSPNPTAALGGPASVTKCNCSGAVGQINLPVEGHFSKKIHRATITKSPHQFWVQNDTIGIKRKKIECQEIQWIETGGQMIPQRYPTGNLQILGLVLIRIFNGYITGLPVSFMRPPGLQRYAVFLRNPPAIVSKGFTYSFRIWDFYLWSVTLKCVLFVYEILFRHRFGRKRRQTV